MLSRIDWSGHLFYGMKLAMLMGEIIYGTRETFFALVIKVKFLATIRVDPSIFWGDWIAK